MVDVLAKGGANQAPVYTALANGDLVTAGTVLSRTPIPTGVVVPFRALSQATRVRYDVVPRRRGDAGAGNYYTVINLGCDPDPTVALSGTPSEEIRTAGRWNGHLGGAVDGNFGISIGNASAATFGRPDALPRAACLFDANDVAGDVAGAASGDRAFWFLHANIQVAGNFGRSITPTVSDYAGFIGNTAIGGAANWKFTHRAASGTRVVVDTGIALPGTDITHLTWLEYWFPTPTTIQWYISTPNGANTGSVTHGIDPTLALFGCGLGLGFNGGFKTTGYYKFGVEQNP